MKTCSLCGFEYENQYLFCPEDGATLINTVGTGSRSAQVLPIESMPALDQDSPAKDGPAEEPGPRVLHCPACAGEYPLTFNQCPVDGARLSAQKMAVTATATAPIGTMALERNEAPAQPVEPQPSIQEAEFPKLVKPATESRITTPLEAEETAPAAFRSSHDLFSSVSADDAGPAPARSYVNRINLVLLVALALITIAAIYAVGIGSREAARQAVESGQPAGVTEEKPSLFVATPQTAVDYSEPVESELPDQPVEERPQFIQPFSITRPQRQREPVTKSQPRPVPVERPIEQTRPRQVTASNSQAQPQIVQAVDRRVNANLIRVRSRRTSSGYRYDLTFTLHDPAGRSFYWEKLVVMTRSASGLVRNQTIAFAHRQGASGLLTFTIGVDLNGATESDWRGTVVCTSLGTDGPGKVIRAGFTANLAPW